MLCLHAGKLKRDFKQCKRHGGIANASRIIGGEDALITDIPYFAQVRYMTPEGPHAFEICGGAIISKKLVLTAGHCPVEFSRDYVYYGTDQFDRDGTTVFIKEVHRHFKYDSKTLTHDIALLVLTENIKFGKKARAIKIPRPDDDDKPRKKCSFVN